MAEREGWLFPVGEQEATNPPSSKSQSPLNENKEATAKALYGVLNATSHDSSQSHQSQESAEEQPTRNHAGVSNGLFGTLLTTTRNWRRKNDRKQWSPSKTRKNADRQPTLFEFASEEVGRNGDEQHGNNGDGKTTPEDGTDSRKNHELAAKGEERPTDVQIGVTSGEKAKARDILSAVRIVKTLDEEKRPATPEERQSLARFPGFGPVALSIFPDPVTGRYKDASWQAIGEELQSLLSPDEYVCPSKFWSHSLPNYDCIDFGLLEGFLPNYREFWRTHLRRPRATRWSLGWLKSIGRTGDGLLRPVTTSRQSPPGDFD